MHRSSFRVRTLFNDRFHHYSYRSIFFRWSCLGIKLASLARSELVPTADVLNVFSGQYVEAAVSWVPAFPALRPYSWSFFLAFSDLWCVSLHRGCSHLVYQGHKRSRTLSCRHYPQLHIFECVALWSKHIPGLTFVHLQIYHSQLQPSFLIHITSLVSLVELY